MVEKTIPTKDERTVVDVYDVTRDNLIRTVDTLTDFYTNIARAWATFYNQQQQQFAQQQQQFTRQ